MKKMGFGGGNAGFALTDDRHPHWESKRGDGHLLEYRDGHNKKTRGRRNVPFCGIFFFDDVEGRAMFTPMLSIGVTSVPERTRRSVSLQATVISKTTPGDGSHHLTQRRQAAKKNPMKSHHQYQLCVRSLSRRLLSGRLCLPAWGNTRGQVGVRLFDQTSRPSALLLSLPADTPIQTS